MRFFVLLTLGTGLGIAIPEGALAQGDPLDAYDRRLNRVSPGIFWTEIGLSTVYDTNIEQNAAYLEGPGLIGNFHAQLRSSRRRPLIRIDYMGMIQQFRASQAWNRDTHSLLGVLHQRLGPIALEAIGSWNANGQTEDREIADAYLFSPRVSIRFRGHRLRAYGRHWARDFEQDDRKETIRTLGGDLRLRPFVSVELELGYRYEEGDSDRGRSRFVRRSITARWRTRLTDRTTLVVEGDRRVRTYPERWVEEYGIEKPTRDVRWIPGAYLSQGRSPGPEMRLGYEYQLRSSNDPRRDYEAHRVTLSFRVPFIGWFREDEPGH